MTVFGRTAELEQKVLASKPSSEFGCGFNRWMQHLISRHREEDVANGEVPAEKIF